MKPLISVVIPVFNRFSLIGETLDSIIAQSYANWECILVDDGSTDNTVNVINDYIEKDQRFKFYQRDNSRTKGGNACRNIGFERSSGEFIIFFDSDDIMTPDHITAKITTILKHDCDYVIAKTRYFNYDENALEHYYKFESKDISAYNFISQKINWLTYDVCIKRSLANKVRFNETIQSGQEFNYFSKLVLISTNAVFFKDILTLRRYHDDSIRAKLRKDDTLYLQRAFDVLWTTYKETESIASTAIKRVLLYKCINIAYDFKGRLAKNNWQFLQALMNVFGLEMQNYIIAFALRSFNNKRMKDCGYLILKKMSINE